MRTKTYEVYPLAELTAEAQQKAYYDWLDTSDYSWNSDNRQTLDAFCDLFGVVCSNWQYDEVSYNFRCSTNHSETIDELTGQRLATYITNNYWSALFPKKQYWHKGKMRRSRIFTDCSCPLTGYYIDEDILQSLYDFISKPEANTSFMMVIHRCIDCFFKACRDDFSYCRSEERFKEESNDNEWEYLLNGKQFS